MRDPQGHERDDEGCGSCLSHDVPLPFVIGGSDRLEGSSETAIRDRGETRLGKPQQGLIRQAGVLKGPLQSTDSRRARARPTARSQLSNSPRSQASSKATVPRAARADRARIWAQTRQGIQRIRIT